MSAVPDNCVRSDDLAALRRLSARMPVSGVILLSGVLLLVFGALVVIAVHSRQIHKLPLPPVATHQCADGPWGQLSYVEIIVQMGNESISDVFIKSHDLTWIFQNTTFSELADMFTAAGLPYEQVRRLLDAARCDMAINGYVVMPSDELVMGLSPEARATIYSVLARDERNVRQNEPFRFPADQTESWFEDSSLSDSTIAMVRSLLYTRGDSVLFSDLDVVLRKLADHDEKIRLLTTLGRSPALLLTLRVSPGEDIEPLVAYWGVNGREAEIRPLLESLARSPSGGEVGMTFLMPAFARERLYRYPNGQGWEHQTCYWSAINFHRDEPDDRFGQLNEVAAEIRGSYTRIDRSQLRFGDLILFMQDDDAAVHACIYVADDIVFTKNGPGRSSPWILMRLPNVLALYHHPAGIELSYYRHKDSK